MVNHNSESNLPLACQQFQLDNAIVEIVDAFGFAFDFVSNEISIGGGSTSGGGTRSCSASCNLRGGTRSLPKLKS